MIKKSIASILIILILINSIGCYSYSQINKEDAEKIEIADEVKITTLNEKVYILSDVTIDGLEVRGVVVLSHSEWLREIQDGEIVISVKEIKKIEVDKYNPVLSSLALLLGVGVLVVVVVFAIAISEYEK